MVQEIEGELLAADGKVAIVVARFNELVTRRLMEGAVSTFRRHGMNEDDITVVWVPGSFEIPIVAQELVNSGDYNSVCCLGAVIQGQTTHHEYINHQVAQGIMQTGLDAEVPVVFGVLTCQTMEQALDRAGGKAGNKGVEAALAAIETVNVLRRLRET